LIARIIEENGGAMVAVHGRTRQQGYKGNADWDAIAEVKSTVSIPVIGNGDVQCVADIDRMKKHTNCDGVMIGRGALGNPWIFARIDRDNVPNELIRKTIMLHLENMLKFYHGQRGVILFRKHLSRYLRPYHLPKEIHRSILTTEDPDKLIDLLNDVLY